MEDEGNRDGIRIVDRRRFDSEGKERSSEQSESKESAPKPVESKPKTETPNIQQQTASNPAPEEDEGDISFSSLLMSLATQALMQLGEMNPPEGSQVPVDPEGAKQTIEIIAMLSRKTKGNLSAEEATLLEEMLHNLRVGYVRVTQVLMKQSAGRK